MNLGQRLRKVSLSCRIHSCFSSLAYESLVSEGGPIEEAPKKGNVILHNTLLFLKFSWLSIFGSSAELLSKGWTFLKKDGKLCFDLEGSRSIVLNKHKGNVVSYSIFLDFVVSAGPWHVLGQQGCVHIGYQSTKKA